MILRPIGWTKVKKYKNEYASMVKWNKTVSSPSPSPPPPPKKEPNYWEHPSPPTVHVKLTILTISTY